MEGGSSSAPRREKEPVRKKSRMTAHHSSEPEILRFNSPAHYIRYEKLKSRVWGQGKYIDWNVLREYDLADEVRDLVSFGGWEHLFGIVEPAFKEITLEFLTTFTLEKKYYGLEYDSSIQFRMMKQRFKMSYTEFSVYMGIYNADFVLTDEYKNLHHLPLTGISKNDLWRRLSSSDSWNPARSKASSLRRPAWRYVHHLLAHSLTGRGHSQGVVGTKDLQFLRSMIDKIPIHLGMCLAQFFYSQASDDRVGSICAGPFVTRLAKGLGFSDRLSALTLVNSMVPINKDTLKAMHFEPPHAEAQEEEAHPDSPHESPDEEAAPSQSSSLGQMQSSLQQVIASQEALRKTQNKHFRRLVRLESSVERNFTALFQHFGIAPPPTGAPTASPPDDQEPEDQDPYDSSSDF